jgi:hypothetical protein
MRAKSIQRSALSVCQLYLEQLGQVASIVGPWPTRSTSSPPSFAESGASAVSAVSADGIDGR